MTQKRGDDLKHKTIAGPGAKGSSVPVGTKVIVGEEGIAALLALLTKVGYQSIGPKLRDGAITYEPISSIDDLPVGMSDEQEPGKYRVVKGTKGAFFEYVCGPTSWKKYLFPPKHKIWEADKTAKGFDIKPLDTKVPKLAFFGVRSCELEAIKIQDKVFGYGREDDKGRGIFSDPLYVERRTQALIIAVNCSRAGKNCFCTSMGGSPHVKGEQGFDLALTELTISPKHEFLIEVGSQPGGLLLEMLDYREPRSSDLSRADAQARSVATSIRRKMIPDVKDVMKRNLDSAHWDNVAERCMNCANCTMSCPTCFCSTVEETTDLKGDHAERWRSWDSCFTGDFSYIHGGAIRRETGSRYRQWITHKLSSWHDQFGTSGCVGCGRCITWCPVGIDITKEAKAIKDSEK